MRIMRRLTLVGLATMGAVALASAIWPAVATVVSILLAVVVTAGFSVPTVLGIRWVRGELEWRRELRTMPPVATAAYGAAPAAPPLSDLRQSA